MIDRYEIGETVLRTAPKGKPIVALYVTDPDKRTVVGSCQAVGLHEFTWIMIASCVGDYRLCWRCADGTDHIEDFEVTNDQLW